MRALGIAIVAAIAIAAAACERVVDLTPDATRFVPDAPIGGLPDGNVPDANAPDGGGVPDAGTATPPDAAADAL